MRQGNRMKKLVVAIIGVLLMGAVSMEAFAGVSWVETATLYPKKDKVYDFGLKKTMSKNEQISAFNWQDIYPKSIRSSKKKVVSPGRKVKRSGLTYSYLKIKKAGSAVISAKAGRTYKYQLKVLKYANPFSSLTMNGEDITANFNGKSTLVLPYSAYKNKTLTFNYISASAAGWRVNGLQAQKKGSLNAKSISNGSPVTITSKKMVLTFHAYNSGLKQNETCQISFR